MTDLARLELRIESTQADRATAALGRFSKSGQRAERTTTKLGSASGRAASGTDRLGRSVQRLDRNAARAARSSGGLARTLGLLGGAFVGLRVLRSVVGTLKEFGDTMAQVQGIAVDATATFTKQGAQMARLTNQTLALGASTRFSAKEVGEGQLFLARAGFELNDILDALPSTLDLAAAGVVDLGTAADIASNVLAQFNLNAVEMARVSDVLVTATVKSNTTLTQLAEGLKLVGPVAASVNQSLELTAATIGILGNAGIQGSMAGTQLRGVIAKLLDPTAGAQKVINQLADSLGVAASQFNVAKKSADGITEPLIRVLDLFSRAETTATEFFQIFGLRQATGAIVLTKFKDELNDLFEAEKNAKGEAERLAAIMEDTLGGAFRRLAAAVEGLKLSIGKAGLTSGLREVIEVVVVAVRILAGADGAFEKAGTSAKALAAIMGGLAASFGILLLASVGVAGAAIFAFIGGPLGAAVVGVGLLVGAFLALKDETISFGENTGAVGDLVAAIWSATVEKIAAAFRVFGALFSAVFKAVKDFTQKVFKQFNEDMIEPVRKAMKIMGVTWGDVLDAMQNALISFINTAATLFLSLFNFLVIRMQRLSDVATALADFDLGSPIEGLKKLGKAFDDAVDLDTFGADLGESILGASFAEKADVAILNAAKGIKSALERSLGPAFVDDLEIALGLGFFDKIFEGFEENAKASLAKLASTGAASLPGLAVEAIFGKFAPVSNKKKQAEAEAFLARIREEMAGLQSQAETLEQQRLFNLENIDKAIKTVEDLRFVISTVFLTNDERTKKIALEEFRFALEDANVTIEEQDRLVTQLGEGFDALFDLEQIREFADELASAFGNGFKDLLTGASSAKDAIRGIAEEINSVVLDKLVIEPLVGELSKSLTGLFGGDDLQKTADVALNGSAVALEGAAAALTAAANVLGAKGVGGSGIGGLGGLFGGGGGDVTNATTNSPLGGGGSVFGAFAKGAAFGGGRGLAASVGSLLDKGPVTFPLGVAGEAGPEAILPARKLGSTFAVRGLLDGNRFDLPLARGSDGALSADLSGIRRRPFALGGVLANSGSAPLSLQNGTTAGSQSKGSSLASGNSGAMIVNNNTFTFPNSNPDAFRKSQRQIEDDLSRTMKNAGRRRN